MTDPIDSNTPHQTNGRTGTTRANGTNARPYLRSLVVKLTLAAALVMLAFGWLRATVTNWAFDTFAIPSPRVSPDEQAHDALVAVMRDRNAAQDPKVAEQLNDYFAARRTSRTLAYLLDRNGEIVARSPELNSLDDNELTAASRFRLAIDGKVLGTAFSYVRPTHEDKQLCGFISSILYDLDLEGLDSDTYKDAVVLDLPAGIDLSLDDKRLAEMEAQRNLYDNISNGVTIGIAVATALLLGIVASFLITRRLRRLAREVEASEANELPGPFRESGRDEISLLAGALNKMRARVTELVANLREQDSNRRDWVAQVSHDIRTPLTSLSVCLDRAQQSLENGDHETTEEALALARHDLRRVRSFVNDLFEIARLEIGDELDLEPIPPLELIADAARSLRPQADLGGIDLQLATEAEVDEMPGDGHRLMRACENLLSNAIRHATDHVRIGAESRDDSVCLYVEDDGLGFGGPKGPVDLSTVTRQASQADSSGLGLLVARRVAEAHGGSIAASNGSRWTRVELRIPRRRDG